MPRYAWAGAVVAARVQNRFRNAATRPFSAMRGPRRVSRPAPGRRGLVAFSSIGGCGGGAHPLSGGHGAA
jgi:hypothetical protein